MDRSGPQPERVRAFVRWNGNSIAVTAEVLERAEHAVRVSWYAPDGSLHDSWVWPSAVLPFRAGSSDDAASRAGH